MKRIQRETNLFKTCSNNSRLMTRLLNSSRPISRTSSMSSRMQICFQTHQLMSRLQTFLSLPDVRILSRTLEKKSLKRLIKLVNKLTSTISPSSSSVTKFARTLRLFRRKFKMFGMKKKMSSLESFNSYSNFTLKMVTQISSLKPALEMNTLLRSQRQLSK